MDIRHNHYLPGIHKLLCLFLCQVLLQACASNPVDSIELMPAPDVYGDGLLNPLPEDYNPLQRIPYQGILYATDRYPADDEDSENYYINERGQVVRLGVAKITLGEGDFDWATAREISMLKNRTEAYPIQITDVEEWGIMGSTIPYWLDVDIAADGNIPPDGSDRFFSAIDEQMTMSGKNDVYIYVHGYKVVFENPVLVSAELWHFLGYKGAFIAYAWPSTPSQYAYIKDSDTSSGYARNLRLLIESVAANTDVEKIHIIGYSNGTRLVVRAMEQLALKHYGESPESIQQALKIENVILVGSDLDRGVFGSMLADGIMNVSSHLSVYLSPYDKALGISRFLTRRERLGQLWGDAEENITPVARALLEQYQNRISFINVSDAEGASTGNGHGYFRKSPWASSDVLMTMIYSLPPLQRGLIKKDELPIYNFPPDYIQKLWDAIEDVDPEFAESYSSFRTLGNNP